MRQKILAGNWKMNLTHGQAHQLVDEIVLAKDTITNAQILFFVPSLYIEGLVEKFPNLNFGSQNFYPLDKGAFTGEISVEQIKNSGVTHVLIGHSERRMIFFENDDFIRQKVNAALKYELKIVFCCGESLEVRNANQHMSFVENQLKASLFHLSPQQILDCTIAYEPVWAIGTGLTASVDQAEEMHSNIRQWITNHYSFEIADQISILYGGSCNENNAKDLFSCKNVDGGLIGGASLNSESFLKIANSF